jgi:hypothetical protein
MNPPSITTSVYKYQRYAPWILGAYCLSLILLFLLSPFMSSVPVGIAASLLLMLPIYVAIRPKSLFSVRSVDERKLSMDAEHIYWSGVTIPVKEVAELKIYLFAFDNFRHRETGTSGLQTMATEYGDQNKLSFRFENKAYDFTFYLGDYIQYRAVSQIISAWQRAGYRLSARSAFEDSFIQKEIAYHAR